PVTGIESLDDGQAAGLQRVEDLRAVAGLGVGAGSGGQGGRAQAQGGETGKAGHVHSVGLDTGRAPNWRPMDPPRLAPARAPMWLSTRRPSGLKYRVVGKARAPVSAMVRECGSRSTSLSCRPSSARKRWMVCRSSPWFTRTKLTSG